eukprot:scaffold109327_cov69-Phaeocystis_antarctica.AAC.2
MREAGCRRARKRRQCLARRRWSCSPEPTELSGDPGCKAAHDGAAAAVSETCCGHMSASRNSWMR